MTGIDEYVHDITWLVNSKETFLQLFCSMSRRVIYHFEGLVSLTYLHDFKKIEKKIKKIKNLITQHYKPGRVGTVNICTSRFKSTVEKGMFLLVANPSVSASCIFSRV